MNVLVCVVRALFSYVKKLLHNGKQRDYPDSTIKDQEIPQGVHKAKMK